MYSGEINVKKSVSENLKDENKERERKHLEYLLVKGLTTENEIDAYLNDTLSLTTDKAEQLHQRGEFIEDELEMIKDFEQFGYDYYILVDVRKVIKFIESKYDKLKKVLEADL